MGLYLEGKLDFPEHLQNIFKKVNKTTSLLCILQNALPRVPFVANYIFFIGPHLDYADILYDQTFNNSIHEKLESIQNNACCNNNGYKK